MSYVVLDNEHVTTWSGFSVIEVFFWFIVQQCNTGKQQAVSTPPKTSIHNIIYRYTAQLCEAFNHNITTKQVQEYIYITRIMHADSEKSLSA